ncbi:MAG TPA: N-acetyl-alpha-D-glucosaminyl L-malate synthase BshA [Candidatus Krumholzibacteria bacterium]|nr:N-acetyl-alpha-D-glucosaminyl L-malate synthase BshA [Candidatus Krumholzibacteria bacterium]
MRLPAIGITCYPTQGGSGVVATELGLHLARHGCAVHFISSSLPFRLQQYSENIFYHPVDMPQYPVFQNSPYTLSLATVMSETAVQHGLDILHVHYAIPHAASAYLAREMVGRDRLKVVTTLHGTDITLVGQEPSFFPITRFMIDQSDAVTAVSHFLREETVRVFGVTRPIEVIPNFVDARLYRPTEDAALRRRLAPGGEQVIMHASNFRKVKNLPAVVATAARVAARRPVRLVLVGDGPEMPAVRAQVAEAGLKDRTVFLGHVDDLAEVLPAADVLLLPSLHESFGLVALEAMACGVVPVVTNRGGAADFVQDGVNGFLRDPEDVEALASAVLQVLGDPALQSQLAEDARRDAAGEFGVACVLKKYLDLYDRLLADSPAAG